MAGLRLRVALVLSLLLFATAVPTPGLYDRPVLTIDPGVHTG
jgi:hypothetical protein